MNSQFPFLEMESKKDNMYNDSDFSEKKYKKFKKFEKFIPKNVNDQEKNQKELKGAENKVKSLLSIFLKDIKNEDQNPENILNNSKKFNKIEKKDIISNKNNLKENRNISKVFSNKKKNFSNSNGFNFETNNISIKNNNINNNFSNNGMDGNIGPSSFFNLQRKVGFNLNSINKLKNTNNNISNNIENRFSLKKKSKRKNKNISSINEIKHNIINNSNKIKKEKNKYIRTQTYNSQNSNTGSFSSMTSSHILNKNSNYIKKRKLTNKTVENNIQTLIKKKTNLLQNNNLNDNLNENINNKKSNDSYIYSKFNNKINSPNKNRKNKISLFKDSINYNNSIISEGSKYNFNQKSLEGLNKISSKSLKKESGSLLSKNNLPKITNTNQKNSIIKNEKKIHSDNKYLKRSTTNYYENKNGLISNKFLRQNTRYKTIKKKLMNSIILRPEDLEINFHENNINKSIYNSSICHKKKKTKKKSRSVLNLIKIETKLNTVNLGNINKAEIGRKNNSCLDNIKVPFPKSKKEKNLKEENKNEKTNKKDSEKKIISKKETLSKDGSFDEFSTKSIKRKNNMYNQKYRRLIHKGNIYDSLDDEEFEDVEDTDSIYLHPNSNFILIFDSFLLLSGLLSFSIVPLYLAKTHDFCKERYISIIPIINLFIETLNIIDLFLGFFRAYYNWEEQLIHKNKNIIKKYLSGWFLFDLIAAVPIYSINKIREPYCNEYEQTTYYNIVINKPHYLLLCNRLFKIFKIFEFNEAWKIISNKLNDITSMIINSLFVGLALNYAGCLYIFIARNNYPNWILNSNLDTSSFIDIYTCTIYILIMAITSVGYGDITCYCFYERIFQLFLLVVGILAYSFAVSSFSNYIKKINEKSADFEKKKSILDEIKVNNPNLPVELYEKIIRFLKFKNFHEKKLENIIFDCLPLSLKNNLIYEMYKSIIKNFIFFKNFQNTDFIVRVILSFKPVIALKNDILINDNDMVEDIMFVKKGSLSVELPINMTNPQENFDKYSKMQILNSQIGLESEKVDSTTILNSNFNNNTKNYKYKNSLGSIIDNNKINQDLKKTNIGFNTTDIFTSGIWEKNLNYSLGNKPTISEKEKEKIDIRYVRILCIRENEHFGDVMMFLEQRSPLRVRVKSKKSELFFLKKMDAIKISTSYPNIWRRINKKSVFNFEQIKKSIKKIIEIYCSERRLNSINEEDSEENSYNQLIKESQIGINESIINIKPKNYDLDNSALKTKREIVDIKRNQSYKISDERLLKRKNFETYNNINERKKISYSSRKINHYLNLSSNSDSYKLKLSSSSSSSLSNNIKTNKKKGKKKRKLNEKLMDAFKGNYKFYKKVNYENENGTIIKEVPGQEESSQPFKDTKSFRNISKISIASKNQKKFYSSIKRDSKEISIQKDNNLNKTVNKNSKIIKKFDKFFKKSENFKLDESSSMKLINEENIDILEKSESNILNDLPYDKIINDEMKFGEEIKIYKEENLLSKKIKFDYPKYSQINIMNNSIEHKNTNLKILLNSFDNKDLSEKNNILINDNNSNNFFYTKNNESLNLLDSTSNKNLNKQRIWEKDSLSINKNIFFQYEPSYENCNVICGEKLIKNKKNQDKLKKFLINEILNINLIKNNNTFRELIHQKTTNSEYHYQINKKENENSIITSKRNLQTIKKGKKKHRKSCNLLGNFSYFNNNLKTFNRTSSLSENNMTKNRTIKNDFQSETNEFMNINTYIPGNKANKIFSKRKILSSKVMLINSLNNSPKDTKKKNLKRKGSLKQSPFIKPKKKKDNLLSQINLNIQKTNQNLNNPEEFYSNYFNFLLEGELTRNNSYLGLSTKVMPKIKKDKNNNLLKNLTRKNSQ